MDEELTSSSTFFTVGDGRSAPSGGCTATTRQAA